MVNPGSSDGKSRIYVNPNFNKASKVTSIITKNRDSLNNEEILVQQKLSQVKTHFNPLFLEHLKNAKIHFNPNFLQNQPCKQSTQEGFVEQEVSPNNITARVIESEIKDINILQPKSYNGNKKLMPSSPKVLDDEVSKIIWKSRTHLIRQPLQPKKAPLIKKIDNAPIVHKTRCKLIRSAVSKPTESSVTISSAVSSPRKVITDNRTKTLALTRKRLSNNKYKYIVDRRPDKLKLKVTGAAEVAAAPTAMLRSPLKQKRTVSIVSRAFNTYVAATQKSNGVSVNKTLQLLNINGILYKSTQNKLQRKVSNETVPVKAAVTHYNRCSKKQVQTTTKMFSKIEKKQAIFIGGTKYNVDGSGHKLIRAPLCESMKAQVKRLDNWKKYTKSNLTSSAVHKPGTVATHNNNSITLKQRNRIDIAGLTYIASPNASNIFVQTKTHLALAHLNNAKQKSIQLLRKSLVKNNMPCKIFQRLGKCAALERDRCSRVHDKNQVAICSKFLRGECTKAANKCLLSHNISYSKMPVCKFFLQGMCVRDDCPYLHKKLSEDAKICKDFQRGYCKRGEKCNLLHEFVQSDGKLPQRPKLKPQSKEVQCNETILSDRILITAENGENIAKSTNAESTKNKQTIQRKAVIRYFNNVSSSSADRMRDNAKNEMDVDVDFDLASENYEKSTLRNASNDTTELVNNLKIVPRRQCKSLPEYVPL